jgi:lipopolysaccharide export system protein LptA
MPFRIFLTFLFVFHAVSSIASTADISKSISVGADYATRNEITGKTEYEGNVVIQQGNILIDAENVTIYYKGGSVSHIICLGSPATYQQQSPDSEGSIVAKGEKVEYHLIDEMISLKSNASLTRNGTFIKGDSIIYNLAEGTWRAKGDTEGNQKRIQLVIPPLTQNTDTKSKWNPKEAQNIEGVL